MILSLVIMLIRKSIYILFIFIITTSCVDSYWPEIDKYDNVLVVDGLLTNDPTDTIVIKLSTSSSINSGELIPLSGSELYITDIGNTEVYLTETNPGTYKVMDNGFTGLTGHSYQLNITLQNGKRYQSDICKLTLQSPIDSVYGLIESHQMPNSNEQVGGVQFYINNHRNIADTAYYLWKLAQTFEYKSSFSIDYIWTGSIFDPYPNPDSLRTCWYTSSINNIFTYTTKYLDKPIIEKLPLNFTSTKSKSLSIRYSLLVKQLSITEEAYIFWDALKQQNIEQNGLYSQQPIQIRGNVTNISDSDEAVLGYFTVAGVTKKRIYINRPPLVFLYDECTPDFDGMRFIRFEPGPIYIVDVQGNLAMGNSDGCFDCRLSGGILTPPSFWNYN